MADFQSRQRGLLLKEARSLAKTGKHKDFAQVMGAMAAPTASDAPCHWLSDKRFVHQINQMCLIYADRSDRPAPVPSTRRPPRSRRPAA